MREVPEHETCYARSQLTGRDLALYNDLADSISRGRNSVRIDAGIDPYHAFDIYKLVLCDHPEFYWFSNKVEWRSLGFRTDMLLGGGKPRRAVDSAMREAADRVLSPLPRGANEYTVAKAVFAHVASSTTYAWEEAAAGADGCQDVHTLAGPFTTGRAVCDGYAAATQYLLQKAGVLAFRLSGTATSQLASGPHSWLLARINGRFYHIDPTWGDMASTTRSVEKCLPQDANYDYFCLTDKEISVSHRAESIIDLPACTSTRDSYYKREGYFLQVWSDAAFSDVMARQLAKGCRYIAARAATEGVFKKMRSAYTCTERVDSLLARAWLAAKTGGAKPRMSEYYEDARQRTVHIKLA